MPNEEKKRLRREIRGLKARLLTPESRTEWSSAICDGIEKLDVFRKAGIILLYCPMVDEVDVSGLFSACHGSKRIAVPLVEGDHLVLKEYDPLHVHRGYRDIIEPDSDSADIQPSEIDFAVIPGMAFDASCRRLGRGGGFYDRLLPSLDCVKAGAAFSFQIAEEVFSDELDSPVDMVVTEKFTLKP